MDLWKTIWMLSAAALLLAGCERAEAPREQTTPAPSSAPPSPPAPAEVPAPRGAAGGLDLYGGKSMRDYQARVTGFIRENPHLQVIVGGGWDSAAFGAQPPHKDQLDQVNDQIPIVLFSGDRRSIWANSEALAAAGIDNETPNPEGGVIERDEGGVPTGLLRERAMRLVEKIIPQ